MGKTTLYHPVSLYVIRGAAAYSGFKFGKIVQLGSDLRNCTARYRAELREWPAGWLKMSPDLMKSTLQDCFLDDVHVSWLGRSRKNGTWAVELQVACPQSTALEAGGGGGGGGGGGPTGSGPLMAELREVVARQNFVVLDTETTGLRRPAEIIDIAIVSHDGDVLMNELIKPRRPIPPFITDLTGISPEDVENAPSWPELKSSVQSFIAGRDVITYNAIFDRHMLHCSDDMWELPMTDYKTGSPWYCAMMAYAELHGEYDGYHPEPRWQKLSEALAQLGLEWRGTSHRALTDVIATMELLFHICK